MKPFELMLLLFALLFVFLGGLFVIILICDELVSLRAARRREEEEERRRDWIPGRGNLDPDFTGSIISPFNADPQDAEKGDGEGDEIHDLTPLAAASARRKAP